MPEETTSEDYMPFIKAQHQRLDLVEAQLAILSERAGVPYQRAADEAPPPVRRLVAEGKRLEAIQELRAGGLSMVDAKRIVDRMWRCVRTPTAGQSPDAAATSAAKVRFHGARPGSDGLRERLQALSDRAEDRIDPAT